jgi:hypothetical protein
MQAHIFGKLLQQNDRNRDQRGYGGTAHPVLDTMQLRSRRRAQGTEKDYTLTPHFIVSVARGPNVA